MSRTQEAAPAGAADTILRHAVTFADGALLLRDDSKVRRWASAATMAAPLVSVAVAAWQKRTRTEPWSIVVDDRDDIYADLHHWVLERIPDEQRRALSARTSRSQEHHATPVGVDFEQRTTLSFFYDSTKEIEVGLDGHTIRVRVEREEGWGKRRDNEYGVRAPELIRFSATDLAGRVAIERFLARVVDSRQAQRTPRLFIAARWGEWVQRRDLPIRTIDTVCLAAGQMERIVADIQTFLDSEQVYARLGMPWHRGIALEGPPGSGKTSIARALASHFDMDVYWLPLGDLTGDGDLVRMVASIPARSVLLLEDASKASKAMLEGETVGEKGVTNSGLRNVLDGMATPHGLITILTDNHINDVDDVLLRKGRIDLREHVGHVDADQATRIVQLAFPHQTVWQVEGDVAPVEVVEAIKASLEHPENLADELRAIGCHLDDEPAVAANV